MADEQRNHYIVSGTRICLEMGTRLNLQIKPDDVPLCADFIGMETDKYIIVTAPHASPACIARLLQEDQISASFFNKETALVFETRVLTMISDPARLLFLEYPKTVQLQDRRAQKRMSCLLPARIGIRSEERQGSVVNINKRGCRCRIENQDEAAGYPDLHEQLALHLRLPEMDDEVELRGDVRNISHYAHLTCLGILFQQHSLETQKALSQYILSTYDYQ